MNTRSRFRFSTPHVLASFVLCTCSALHSQTIAPPAAPAPFATSNPTDIRDASGRSAPAASNIASILSSDLPLFSLGSAGFRPHFTYSYKRSKGLIAAPGVEVDTTTHSYSAGVLVEATTHWQLDYTALWTDYSSSAFKNSVDHVASANGAYDFDPLQLSFNAGYSVTHPMLVEAAHQAKDTRYGGGVGGQYQLGNRSRLEFGANYEKRETSPLSNAPDWTPSDASEWSSSEAIHYQVTTRVGASAGLSFGESMPSIGPSAFFTRPGVTIDWNPTDRISVQAHAANEYRRFRGATSKTMKSPVYDGALRYRPFSATSVYVLASRGVASSNLADLVARTTSWSAGIEQRFLQLLYWSVSYGEQRTRYIRATPDLATLDNDRYKTFGTRLSVPILRHGSISAFYEETRNNASRAGYGFNTEQMGVEFTIRF